MHESTQRIACRGLFVLCALIPAVATVLWIAYSMRPWREVDWQQTISQQLHVRVNVEEVVSPRPGKTHLQGVTLSDLHSGEPLGSIDLVRVHWRNSRLVLDCDQLEISADSFSALAATLSTALSASELPPCQLQAKALAVVGSRAERILLTQMRCFADRGRQSQGKLVAQAELPVAADATASPTIKIVAERFGTTTSATLDTGGGRIPSWLLRSVLPGIATCPGSTYAGVLRLQGDATQVQGSLDGRFEELDAKSWIDFADEHSFAAMIDMELEQLRWTDGRIDVAHGSLTATGGSISPSLLQAFVERLRCKVGPAAMVAGLKVIDFDELSCGFHLTSRGLSVLGRCRSIHDGAPGCMLAAGGEPVLVEPESAVLPVTLIVQVLSRPARSWIPGSREANEMAGSLPLPRVGPVPSDTPQQEVATQPKDSKSR